MHPDDRPEFSVREFILSGLLIGGAVSSLIFTAKLFYDQEFLEALQSAGLTLVLAAAVTDPVNVLVEGLIFPFRFLEPSGHETKFSFVASFIGFALVLVGWLLGFLPGEAAAFVP